MNPRLRILSVAFLALVAMAGFAAFGEMTAYSLVGNGTFSRVSVLEEPRSGGELVANRLRLKPFETATVRLSGALPEIRLAVAEPWTGLLTRPRAFAGGKGGPTYLLWNADLSPDFDHYELFRDGELIATVANIVDEGVPYRNARYEDRTATPGPHHYELRTVYKKGRLHKDLENERMEFL